MIKNSLRTAFPTLVLGLSLSCSSAASATQLSAEDENKGRLSRDLQILLQQPSADGPQDPLSEVLAVLDAGETEEARRRLDELLQTDVAKRASAWELDGVIRALEGDLPGSERSLRKAIAMDPDQLSAMTKLGIVEDAQGRRAQARATLEKSVRRNPNDALARRYLAEWALEDKDVDSAIMHYQLAVKDVPKWVTPLHVRLAGLYQRQRRFEDVIALLKPIADERWAEPQMLVLLASAYLELGRPEPARAAIDMLRSIDAGNEAIPVLDAIADREDGQLKSAEAKLRGILSKSAGNARARYQLGLTLARAGQWQAGLAEMERAAAGRDDALTVRLEMARIRLAHGETDRATRDLALLADSSQNPAPSLLLIEGYLQAGNTDAARREADRVVERHPKMAIGYLVKASILQASGKSAEAVELAERTTRAFPASVESWSTYAGLLQAQGDSQSAARALKTGLERNPNNADLGFQLAANYHGRGLRQQAEAEYQRLLESHPEHLAGLNNLAALLADEPTKREEALRLARKAYDLAPDSPVIQDTLGWTLHLSGNDTEAERLLVLAETKLPNDPGVLCHLGSVYAAQKKTAKARSALERCLALQPDESQRSEAAALLKTL